MCYCNNCTTSNSPSRSFHKSNFIIAIAIDLAIAIAEFYESNFIIAIAAAFAIDFAIVAASLWFYKSNFLVAVALAIAFAIASMGAEFIAAVTAAKAARYLRSMLT